MKERIEELISKYQKKLNYREERLEHSKEILEFAKERYENGSITFESLHNTSKDEAIQQDLYNILYEIVKDLKEIEENK